MLSKTKDYRINSELFSLRCVDNFNNTAVIPILVQCFYAMNILTTHANDLSCSIIDVHIQIYKMSNYSWCFIRPPDSADVSSAPNVLTFWRYEANALGKGVLLLCEFYFDHDEADAKSIFSRNYFCENHVSSQRSARKITVLPRNDHVKRNRKSPRRWFQAYKEAFVRPQFEVSICPLDPIQIAPAFLCDLAQICFSKALHP